ncbi:uncharacterized protein LOC115080399 [Rhinatrema bivittatum]|uniref:uncharacterized protein LOC115080399 n=1 Tax=Rhinatrema bivittatum TaxID=194408 RepID=UPI00112AC387|nr:uncharacterized protein LOC115080399 [Rhinatrema bivittatum]
MGRQSKTKSQKKARASAIHTAQEEFGSVPHSFVFHRGQVGKTVQQLVLNMRRVMEPYTATTLKVQKKNRLKDFVSVVGPLGVTHFLVFSKTSENINFRLARVPQGPTLTFRVTEYSLIKDVVSSLKHHRMHEQQFTHPPLLVLNNFGLPGMHVKVMTSMLQNLFPSINVHKVNLNAIKRCILIHYEPGTQLISFRHYSLKVVPVGMSRGVKKLLQERFPNMSRWEDISDLLAPGANLSESEAEQDGEHNVMELPQAYAGRGNIKAQQSAVRLTEIGPRMTLQLVKIEEGLNDGKVLYHSFVHKTEEELKTALERKEEKLRLKAERRKKQERDIAQKKAQREEHKKKSLQGMQTKPGRGPEGDAEAEDPGPARDEQAAAAESSEEDDDAEYYRQEVGREPDADLFLRSGKRKRAGPCRSPHPGEKFKAGRARQGGEEEERSPGRPQRKKRRFLSSSFPGLGHRRTLGVPGKRGPWGSTAMKGKGGPRGPAPQNRAFGQKGKGGPRGQAPQNRAFSQKGKGGPRGPAPQNRAFGQKGKGGPRGPAPQNRAFGQKGKGGPRGPAPQNRAFGQKGKGGPRGPAPQNRAFGQKGKGGPRGPAPQNRAFGQKGKGGPRGPAPQNRAFGQKGKGGPRGPAPQNRAFGQKGKGGPRGQAPQNRAFDQKGKGGPQGQAPQNRAFGQKKKMGPLRQARALWFAHPAPRARGKAGTMEQCNASFAAFQVSFLPAVFGLEFLLALGGNALALYLFLAREKTWHAGIVYSVNLAVSDLLYALSLPLLVAYYFRGKDWTFGEGACKLERFLFNCNLYGSVGFITCISLNRYVAIVHPLYARGRLGPGQAKAVSLAVWALVAAACGPVLGFSSLERRGNATECLGTAPDQRLPAYLPYSLFLACSGCGLPFLLSLASYAAVARTVWRNENVGGPEKRKVLAVACVVLALYAVSFLPYHALRNLNLYRRMRRLDQQRCGTRVHSAFQVTKGLVTLNMCVHPLLYTAVAESMRSVCSCAGRKKPGGGR